jgi:prophage antirepressor-like protein
MKELQIFENEQFGRLRTYCDENGNFWFVGADICAILGIHNPSSSLSLLDDDEKITLDNIYGNPRSGIPHQIGLVSEPGLYSLILRSRKPEAKAFKRWVTHEVIPAIRKTGEYRLPDAAPANPVSGKTSDDLINARIQVVTLRIMGGLSIYTPALRMKFLAEAASLMSGKPVSEYLPPENGQIPDQWVTAGGLARRCGLSNAETGRFLKKRGFHGTQDETREWSQPVLCPGSDGLCRVIGYLYKLDVVGPLLEEAMAEHQRNHCCH